MWGRPTSTERYERISSIGPAGVVATACRHRGSWCHLTLQRLPSVANMTVERVYHIECPTCGKAIDLLETMLEKIVRNRHVSDTGAPFLTLVCSGCTKAFRYNYEGRSFSGLMPESFHTQDQRYPTAVSFVGGCENTTVHLLYD
jgi:hypothetical protein